MKYPNLAALGLLLFILIGCSNPVETNNQAPRSTQIHFTLPNDTHVEVWVENSYETRVKTLMDKDAQAGPYILTFKMVDEDGNTLPEGLYRYCIKTDDNFAAHEMIIAY